VYLTEFSLPGLDRHRVTAVRWELFVFRDVRDVLPGSRPDTVVVAHRGGARPAAWRTTLLAAGIGSCEPTATAAIASPRADRPT